MDWSTHFPAFRTTADLGHSEDFSNKSVEIADIGCGFGGLLVALSPVCPESLIIGMELRTQVTDYVVSRIAALRSQNSTHQERIRAEGIPPYHNISAIRTNTMKFMSNYFEKSSLAAIFLCFPDPHFKARKHKARIVSAQLSAEYAYVMRPTGKVYTITDVEELHKWMVSHFVGEDAGDVSELWEQVSDKENDADPKVQIMSEETEEGKKVTRNGGKKHVAVFRRKNDPAWPEPS